MNGGELVDVVDENDSVVGCVPRSEMRRRRLLHRCTYVFLVDSTAQIFIHRRTRTKDVYPEFWDVTIGGVVAAGEDYDCGARREVEEEVGLQGAVLTPLFPMAYEDEFTRTLGMVYECNSDRPLRLQPEEIEEGRWISRRNLAALLERERFCPDGVAILGRYLRWRPCPSEE